MYSSVYTHMCVLYNNIHIIDTSIRYVYKIIIIKESLWYYYLYRL